MDKVFEGKVIFVCSVCGLERRGSEVKNCAHLYEQYIFKGSERWRELFGNKQEPPKELSEEEKVKEMWEQL